MTAAPHVLVVGAAGALGRPVVQLLRERGVTVRALGRHPAQAAGLAALGAEVVAGDLTEPASLQRACQSVTRVLACAHGLLEKGKAQLSGPGTKPRNFVAASDVARFAVQALLDAPLPFTTLDIGGHGSYSNLDLVRLYAQAAGVAARVSHLPAGVARALSVLVRPLHPGMARVMHLMSLPDDAFDEGFDGAAALETRFGLHLKRVPDFVREQVALAGRTPAH